jgi:predicted ATP-dependent Lon-type protease
VDYLAEALREMRKHNFTEVSDRYFSMGAHLNARDRKAVRKTVSGLMKILFPHAEVTQEELAEILENGWRRCRGDEGIGSASFQLRPGEEGRAWYSARDLDTSDMHIEVIDLLGNRVEAEVGVAFFVACYSALRKTPVSTALLVLGDMSVQGNIKPLRSLTEPLQMAKDNGAKRALIPIENKRNFLDVSADIMEHVDPVFYGDPKTAAMKVLGNL